MNPRLEFWRIFDRVTELVVSPDGTVNRINYNVILRWFAASFLQPRKYSVSPPRFVFYQDSISTREKVRGPFPLSCWPPCQSLLRLLLGIRELPKRRRSLRHRSWRWQRWRRDRPPWRLRHKQRPINGIEKTRGAIQFVSNRNMRFAKIMKGLLVLSIFVAYRDGIGE